MTSFVAYVRSFKNEGSAIVLACDDVGLAWLLHNFEQARIKGNEGIFLIGDGNPIASDDRCTINVCCTGEGGKEKVERKGPSQFFWAVPQDKLPMHVGKISGLLFSAGSGHQYVDMDDISSPTIVISKGEYTPDLLRAMRE